MDAITGQQIRRILRSGLLHLPPLRREIIRALYLKDEKFTLSRFLKQNRLTRDQFTKELEAGMTALRELLIKLGVSGIHDVL